MKKSTSKLLEELKGCSDFKDFHTENEDNIKITNLSEYLCRLIDEKNLKKADIVKNSEMSSVYAYQIISGIRVPERNKLLCIILGMGLNLDETQALLKATGYTPLYVKIPFDCVIIYAICKHLNVVETNNILYDYGEETIG